MYFLACDCANITVIVKNNASIYQNSTEGFYGVSEKINGQATWVLYRKAIWYSGESANVWVIGDLSEIGTLTGGIFSSGKNGRFSCPYEATNVIEFFKGIDSAIELDLSNDITIQCTTTLQGESKPRWSRGSVLSSHARGQRFKPRSRQYLFIRRSLSWFGLASTPVESLPNLTPPSC